MSPNRQQQTLLVVIAVIAVAGTADRGTGGDIAGVAAFAGLLLAIGRELRGTTRTRGAPGRGPASRVTVGFLLAAAIAACAAFVLDRPSARLWAGIAVLAAVGLAIVADRHARVGRDKSEASPSSR